MGVVKFTAPHMAGSQTNPTRNQVWALFTSAFMFPSVHKAKQGAAEKITTL